MNYREHPALSQSTIKKIMSASFGEQSVSDSMIFGSLVDMMLTQEELLDDSYAVLEIKVSEKPGLIVDEIMDYYSAGAKQVSLRELDKDYILALMDKHEYNNRYKDRADQRRFDKFYEESEEYYNVSLLSQDKTIVSKEVWDNAIWVRDSILNGQFTKGFHDLLEDCEVKYQLEIFTEIDDVQVKGALDMVIINHGEQKIINGQYIIPAKSILPVDYKVLDKKSTRYFDYRRFRYDIQGSFYLRLLRDWMLQENLHEYDLLPFHFIVGSLGQTPYVHVLSRHDKQIGEWGGKRVPTDDGYKIIPASTYSIDANTLSSKLDLDVLGWRQGIYLYKWYHEYHEEMQYDKEAIEEGGIFQSNVWGK